MRQIVTLNIYKNNQLENSYEKIPTILKENTFKFILEDIKTIISSEKIIRENKEYTFNLNLKRKKATYLLKEQNSIFDIEVEKAKYEKKNNIIIIEYKISSEEQPIKIEIIMEGDINE